MNTKERIEDKLKLLKLSGISAGLDKQLAAQEFLDMPFLERLDDLLDQQVICNRNKRINTLQKQANLRWPHARLSDIDFALQKGLKKQVIANLADLSWLDEGRHITATGPTGTGKTHLACAFANEAILRGIPVKFFKFQDLLVELIAADHENELAIYRRRLNRYKLLVIDDWGISMLSSAQRYMLYNLVESRDKNCSMIITSQYPISDWYDAFGDETVAESVLDRIVHSSYKLNLTGVSMRQVGGITGGKNG